MFNAIFQVNITSLLEEDQENLAVKAKSLQLYLKPFQIITLRLIFKNR